jgi:hypothetical protein
MPYLRMWKLNVPPKLAPALRYGLAVVSVDVALTLALTMRYYHLPHPFASFSMAAIAVTFWYAGAGPARGAVAEY